MLYFFLECQKRTNDFPEVVTSFKIIQLDYLRSTLLAYFEIRNKIFDGASNTQPISREERIRGEEQREKNVRASEGRRRVPAGPRRRVCNIGFPALFFPYFFLCIKCARNSVMYKLSYFFSTSAVKCG
ncbi:hypothetical protein EVAR_52654_1 [Eumeta japonica]|uniref:Uncharacterized protein n=1 Tax=Eumeta variegata TaxID=151549 RepID=A0A4C1Z2D6_EUMVA|nr:hypothetical protein EVAR_52654_1 [Eumeta japonica]